MNSKRPTPPAASADLKALIPSWEHEVNGTLFDARQRLLIPPRWVISIEPVTPEEFPHAHGSASWSYLPNAHYRLKLRTDLLGEQLRWTIYHELLEMILARYADFCIEQIEARVEMEPFLNYLHQQHGDVRNEVVEWLLQVILGTSRPFTP